MFSFLTEPNFPKAAVGIEKDRVTALALRKEGRSTFGVKSAASVDVPRSILEPDFTEPNISSRPSLMAILNEAASLSGLLGQKDWAVALPTNAARTAILTLEKTDKGETEQVLDWKAEQSFGEPAAHLRISRHRIADDSEGRMRYFASSVKLTVIDEYETVLEEIGWRAGLILPRPVCEANWLLGRPEAEDSLLLSSQDDGFTAVMICDGEPNVVRSVTCTESEKDDEIYRLLMYYNDRFAAERGAKQLNRVLTVGSDLKPSKIVEIAQEALGRTISILRSDNVGLNLPDSSISFEAIAAPAGLAALGYR
ncbi:MAG: hypothetical protein ACRD6X_10330 [Pyrinomonadaceae bacterium]